MKATTTLLKGKAIDGKEFKVFVYQSFLIGEDKAMWTMNGDFFYKTKAKCLVDAKNSIQNQIEDYEYDNNLRK
jgi:hypothetical protein